MRDDFGFSKFSVALAAGLAFTVLVNLCASIRAEPAPAGVIYPIHSAP